MEAQVTNAETSSLNAVKDVERRLSAQTKKADGAQDITRYLVPDCARHVLEGFCTMVLVPAQVPFVFVYVHPCA